MIGYECKQNIALSKLDNNIEGGMGQNGRSKSQFDNENNNNKVKLNACYSSQLVKWKVAINCFRFIFESFFGFVQGKLPFFFSLFVTILFMCSLDIFRIAFANRIWYDANNGWSNRLVCIFISQKLFFLLDWNSHCSSLVLSSRWRAKA